MGITEIKLYEGLQSMNIDEIDTIFGEETEIQ